MTRLSAEDFLALAKELHEIHGRRVYFHIPDQFVVERTSLTYSHNHVYIKHDAQFHFPIYTFNNKLYIHTSTIHPLGEGHKIGPSSPAGAHFYPQDD